MRGLSFKGRHMGWLGLTFQDNLAMTKLHVQGVEANNISCTNSSMTLSSFVRMLWEWNNVASKC